MISEVQLIEWKRLSDMASDGPWDCTEVIAGVDNFVVHQRVGEKFGAKCIASQVSSEDAEFMIAARSAIPALIAEVRKLQKDLDGLAHDNTALELKNEQLQKEAGWLSEKCATLDGGIADLSANEYREIARREIHGD